MTARAVIGIAIMLAAGATSAPSGYSVRAAQAAHSALLANEQAEWQPAEVIHWGPPAYGAPSFHDPRAFRDLIFEPAELRPGRP